jgi:hypothetical protein
MNEMLSEISYKSVFPQLLLNASTKSSKHGRTSGFYQKFCQGIISPGKYEQNQDKSAGLLKTLLYSGRYAVGLARRSSKTDCPFRALGVGRPNTKAEIRLAERLMVFAKNASKYVGDFS